MLIFLKKFFVIIKNLQFNIPNKKNYLIFDEINYEYFQNYIGKKNFNILSFRNNKFNFFAILYSLVFFYKSEIKIEYIIFFLKFSKKKTILSFNYNRLVLFRIKKYYPQVKVIVAQNGLASHHFLNKLDKQRFDYCCDFFFCFSNIEAKIFKKKIRSNYIVIGSIKNNHYHIIKKNKKREVIFISQFRNKELDFSVRSFFDTYNYTLKLLFPILSDFCKKNNLILSILGSSDDSNIEIKYYKKFIKNHKFNFYKRNNQLSYTRVENALFGIGVESTLIYEMLSRGNKVGIFNFGLKKFGARDEVLISKFLLKNQGKFYLKFYNKVGISKILNYLLKVSRYSWNQDNIFYKEIVPFNKMNLKLKEVLKDTI